MSAAVTIVMWALAKSLATKLFTLIAIYLCGRWTATTYGWERVFWYVCAAINVVVAALIWLADSVDAGDLARALNL